MAAMLAAAPRARPRLPRRSAHCCTRRACSCSGLCALPPRDAPTSIVHASMVVGAAFPFGFAGGPGAGGPVSDPISRCVGCSYPSVRVGDTALPQRRQSRGTPVEKLPYTNSLLRGIAILQYRPDRCFRLQIRYGRNPTTSSQRNKNALTRERAADGGRPEALLCPVTLTT